MLVQLVDIEHVISENNCKNNEVLDYNELGHVLIKHYWKYIWKYNHETN